MVKAWIALLVCFYNLILPFHALAAGLSGNGYRIVYGTTPVGLVNWVPIISNTPYVITFINSTDTSGQTLEIGMCDASASANAEVRQMLLPPGGTAQPIQIPQGQRVSIRAVSAAASAGENDFNVKY